MDCPVCNSVSSPIVVRPVKYTICGSCYEGARSIMALISKLDHNAGVNKSAAHKVSLPNPSKGFANALRWVKEMKETEEELSDRLSYLAGFVSVFKDQIHTDIQVKPGSNGPCIPAHRSLLAARSTIFRNMLDFDGCMGGPSQDTVKLPELNYEELQAFLEFLYSGNLPREKIEKHVYSLSVAADKYEVPFLQKFCDQHMLTTLDSSNALDVLEISDTCSSQGLKEATLRFIVQSMDDIVFSPTFDAFALKNPHLSVQITRASCHVDSKTRRNGI